MDTFFPTSTPATIEKLQDKVAQLERTAETREGVLSKALENNRVYQAQIDNFIETLANYVREGDVGIEIADDLAECFGRELTRKVVGHIRIEGDIELEIPAYFDLDDIGDELDISIGQAYASAVRIDYSDVSVVEVEEN